MSRNYFRNRIKSRLLGDIKELKKTHPAETTDYEFLLLLTTIKAFIPFCKSP